MGGAKMSILKRFSRYLYCGNPTRRTRSVKRGAEAVQCWIDFQKFHALTLGVAFLQPQEGVLLIAQPGVICRHLPWKIELQVAWIILQADSMLQQPSVTRLGVDLLGFRCHCRIPACYGVLSCCLDARRVLPLAEMRFAHVELCCSIIRINLCYLLVL